jgi:hypothetical protein
MRSLELSAYRLPLPKEFFPSKMFEIFSSILAYRIFVLLLVVVFFHYVIYCYQYHEPLCNIKKQTVNDLLQVSAVSSTNKTDCHDITEILLKVALNNIKPNQQEVKVYVYRTAPGLVGTAVKYYIHLCIAANL